MSARFSPLYLQTDGLGKGDCPLTVCFVGRISADHHAWLKSDQAKGIWNYRSEQMTSPGVLGNTWQQGGISAGHMWVIPAGRRPKTEIKTTVWFSDITTATVFKLTFG